MLGEDGLESARPARRVDVADDAHDHHGRRLDDGHRLHYLLLVHLRTGFVHLNSQI